jgi:hypothetical protein
MTKTFNIRIEADRAALEASGYFWALTERHGWDIYLVVSKHRTYEAAEKAAKGREFRIRDVRDTTSTRAA